MSSRLVQIITSPDAAVRNQSLDAFCRAASLNELVAEANELEVFRRRSENLYERVRALFFLYALHRFHLPLKPGVQSRSLISFHGYGHLLQRRFEEAIATFLEQAFAKYRVAIDGVPVRALKPLRRIAFRSATSGED